MPIPLPCRLCVVLALLAAPVAHCQAPAVPAVEALVQPLLDEHLPVQNAEARKGVASAVGYPASFRAPLRDLSIADPWAGMVALEAHGLEVIGAARRAAPIPPALDAMSAAIGKPPGAPDAVDLPLRTWDDCLEYVRTVVRSAAQLREEALGDLSPEERRFLFERAPSLVATYGPQSPCNENTYAPLREDLRFFTLVHERMDWAKLVGAAQTLATLSERSFTGRLARLARRRTPVPVERDGIAGEVLWLEQSPHGLLIIGGFGHNTYRLDAPVAALLDLGGDDTYEGLIAANSLEGGVSIVVDLAGNDTYRGADLGLATGRLGVGILADLTGDDTYEAGDGAGGTAFAGVGVLHDAGGTNTYTGTRWSLGAAMGGLGLVLGGKGADRYAADIYSLGIAGPLAVGTLVDLGGDDAYRCGFRYGSGYNRSDAPNAQPGDPSYQYEGWGMGMGLGRRIYPLLTEEQAEFRLTQLAGGVGMLLDVAGDDFYESSNFSVGCGYYFGAGLKLDLAGSDTYRTARYANGSGAHQAMGLAIDYAGADLYTSTGPTYHGGCSWDRSAFMCIDAGDGDDRYELQRSPGLGIADHGSWGIFADLGGNDTYAPAGGMGRASGGSLAVFYDHAGDDDYSAVQGRDNGMVIPIETGGLFVDR